MKGQKQKPEMHRQVVLSSEECSALVCALDYLLHCDDYSYIGKDFTWETAADAVERVEDHETTYRKNELSVFIAAIDCALQGLRCRDTSFNEVADIFPDLIPDLEDAAQLLKDLQPRLCAYLDDLS